MNSRIWVVLASLLVGAGASAQSDFDLSSQRGEVQVVNPVGGERHRRHIEINPTPKECAINENRLLMTPGSWGKVSVPESLRGAVPELLSSVKSGKGPALKVTVGEKAALKAGVNGRRGSYRLDIDPDRRSVTVTARDDAGAYYGLQTLRQICSSAFAAEGVLPETHISDWPELERRGIVEGFYGTPWSHEVRLGLLDYCGRNKLNTYVFGPKDDPYHSSPYWRLPYPAEQGARISELASRAKANRVDFVWAIHPGKDIRWDDADRDSLLRKFEMMYDLGVRNFAIHFDDIEGIGADPRRQVELLNWLDREFVRAKGDVGNLTVCPTDYSRMWASPRPGGALDTYGRTLNPGIEVFYTGDVVCSDMTRESLGFMNALIRRPAYYWWNFPVTDYARNFLMQGPVYGLETDVTAEDACGILSNPMEHGEASKTALYSLADYAWNPAAYNPMDSWERALADVAGPGAADAYRAFAIHSCDTQTGYRRDESWESRIPGLDDVSESSQAALRAEMALLEAAPAMLRQQCGNAALIAELDPWLDQAGPLAERVCTAMDLSRLLASKPEPAALWAAYTGALMDTAARSAYEAHTLGSLRLQPYYERVMTAVADSLYAALTGSPASRLVYAGSYRNLSTPESRKISDLDDATFYHSNQGQRNGDRVAVDLGSRRPVGEIRLLQGRYEGDTDAYDSFVIECSDDALAWTALTDTVTGKYEYTWTAESPVETRYVRLRRLDGKNTHWLALRTFEISPERPSDIIWWPKDVDEPSLRNVIDSDPKTWYDLDGDMVLGAAGTYVLTLSAVDGGAVLRQPGQPDAAPLPIQTVTVPDGGTVTLSGRMRVHDILKK